MNGAPFEVGKQRWEACDVALECGRKKEWDEVAESRQGASFGLEKTPARFGAAMSSMPHWRQT